jgi:hypothetical protein
MPAESVTGLYTVLITNGSIALLAIVAFCVLRKSYVTFYEARAPRMAENRKAPVIGPRLFSWLTVTLRTKEDKFETVLGLDAIIYLKFQAMACRVFCIFLVLGTDVCCVGVLSLVFFVSQWGWGGGGGVRALRLEMTNVSTFTLSLPTLQNPLCAELARRAGHLVAAQHGWWQWPERARCVLHGQHAHRFAPTLGALGVRVGVFLGHLLLPLPSL